MYVIALKQTSFTFFWFYTNFEFFFLNIQTLYLFWFFTWSRIRVKLDLSIFAELIELVKEAVDSILDEPADIFSRFLYNLNSAKNWLMIEFAEIWPHMQNQNWCKICVFYNKKIKMYAKSKKKKVQSSCLLRQSRDLKNQTIDLKNPPPESPKPWHWRTWCLPWTCDQ